MAYENIARDSAIPVSVVRRDQDGHMDVWCKVAVKAEPFDLRRWAELLCVFR